MSSPSGGYQPGPHQSDRSAPWTQQPQQPRPGRTPREDRARPTNFVDDERRSGCFQTPHPPYEHDPVSTNVRSESAGRCASSRNSGGRRPNPVIKLVLLSTAVIVILAIIGVLIIGIVGKKDHAQGASPTPAKAPVKPGECLKPVPQPSGGPRYEKVPCTDDLFSTVVSKVGQGEVKCPDNPSRQYDVTLIRNKDGKPEGYMCLALNLHKDRCYSFSNSNEQVACSDPQAQVRVVDRAPTIDPAKCPGAVVVYKDMKLSYCLAAPK